MFKCWNSHVFFVQAMTGMFGLRKQVTAQEKKNVELTNSNTTLRKQVLDFGRTNAE